MTYRERLENRLARREEWATKAAQRSAQRFETVHQIADNIPMGQPILVGHHSERHARRDQDRILSNGFKGVEEQRLSEHHTSAASGIERQLRDSIFNDDEDATEALEARASRREAKAERMVAVNKAYRAIFAKTKDAEATLRQLHVDGVLTEADIPHVHRSMRFDWTHAYKQPFPSWEITNLRASIRRDRERAKEVVARTERAEKAEAQGGVIVTGSADPYGSVRVTFAEKPPRETINALKAAHFYWHGGSWNGIRKELPAGIA